jgi:hypothetical protein
MKKFLFVYSLLLAISSFASRKKEEVMIATTNIHVPRGFDDNDYVTLVITGDLPSTCFLRPYGEAKIIDGHINISTKAWRVNDPNATCITATIPYMISVPIGPLGQGNYPISVNANTADAKQSAITIEQPGSQNIDNNTYANITNVSYKPESKKLILEGIHPSSCMELKSVQILVNANKDTFSLLPIIEQIQPLCDRSTKPFVYALDLPELGQKDIVFHIRKMDGNALNYLLNKEVLTKIN